MIFICGFFLTFAFANITSQNFTVEHYSFEEKEIEAIKFMIDEIDLILPHSHKYRSKFDRIMQAFHRNNDLQDRDKRILIRIYEQTTDLTWKDYDS